MTTVRVWVLSSAEADVLDHVAPDVFDDPINAKATRDFLADDRHHLVVATEDDVVVGFISAVHYVHPDKPRPELWINEVGVAPTHQRRGLATSMMKTLLQRAREAWVLTDRSNAAANGLYRLSGGVASVEDHVMYSFELAGEP
ncbi:MAG: GNAT family N-acetyltransferase [Pseudomonadota bacterium]